jgi:hypothetical protein
MDAGGIWKSMEPGFYVSLRTLWASPFEDLLRMHDVFGKVDFDRIR